MKIIIDSRMRKIEKDYLAKFGDLVEITPQVNVYEEISGHPDIFFCKINDQIFRSPDININIGKSGCDSIGKTYPDDIKYNVCQIGKYAIHNFGYTDKAVLNYINKTNLVKVQVKQGYSNCSISVISEKSCITSDFGIYETLKSTNIDCLYLKENNIGLLNKNGIKTKMNGFIGGATCIINNEFILFGDSDYLENKKILLYFLQKYNIRLVDFKNCEIIDYGGIITN